MSLPLSGRRIAVPESRELDLFSAMLERQGAAVIRCPLVLIRDLDDTAEMDAWLGRLVSGGHQALILYTGEGVTRLLARAEALGQRPAALAAFAAARKITRGPKPVATLRRAGLNADVLVDPPTTQGLLAMLPSLALAGLSVGVQLYPDADGDALQTALIDAGARYDPVLPYRYVADEADAAVAGMIDEMAEGRVQLIAFTSSPQVRRLVEVAERLGIRPRLDQALARTPIAAVGPVVAKAVVEIGGRVAIAPDDNFHLKPMVGEIVRALSGPGPA